MAKKTNKTENQLHNVGEAISNTEKLLEENQGKIVIMFAVVIVSIACVYFYNNLYLKPLNNEASSEIFMAEMYFKKDSFNLALNGDGQYLGFLDVAEDYSSTKTGNLACYYSGICFLKLQQYENAIEYLSKFNSKDLILSSLALGCIGDAYVELDDFETGLNYYEKAVKNSNNEFTAPKFLLKSAMIHEKNGNYSKALDIYTIIKESFSESPEAVEIERYISRAKNR